MISSGRTKDCNRRLPASCLSLQARLNLASGRCAPFYLRRHCNRCKIKHMNYENIITIEPGKRGGKPCIRGMRITVYDVLSYLAAGMTSEEILEDFPYLTREDILAALSFVAEREGHTLAV